jgi:hypothetical protein
MQGIFKEAPTLCASSAPPPAAALGLRTRPHPPTRTLGSSDAPAVGSSIAARDRGPSSFNPQVCHTAFLPVLSELLYYDTIIIPYSYTIILLRPTGLPHSLPPRPLGAAPGLELLYDYTSIRLKYHTIIILYTIPYPTILYHTIPYYTILYYSILFYTILYYSILFCNFLFYSVL